MEPLYPRNMSKTVCANVGYQMVWLQSEPFTDDITVIMACNITCRGALRWATVLRTADTLLWVGLLPLSVLGTARLAVA